MKEKADDDLTQEEIDHLLQELEKDFGKEYVDFINQGNERN